MYWQDSISGRDKNLSLLHNVRIGSRAHSAFYEKGAEVKNSKLYLHSPIRLYGLVLN
jgi:hypothetical protein